MTSGDRPVRPRRRPPAAADPVLLRPRLRRARRACRQANRWVQVALAELEASGAGAVRSTLLSDTLEAAQRALNRVLDHLSRPGGGFELRVRSPESSDPQDTDADD